MKQILEISNVKFDAEKNQTTFDSTRYEAKEDGSAHVLFKRAGETVDGQPDMAEYGKSLIAAGEDIEVTVTDTPTVGDFVA